MKVIPVEDQVARCGQPSNLSSQFSNGWSELHIAQICVDNIVFKKKHFNNDNFYTYSSPDIYCSYARNHWRWRSLFDSDTLLCAGWLGKVIAIVSVHA